MTKQDIFYYAKADGIPCYYQPETEEIIPRNKLCELLMDIQNWFWDIFGTPEQFKIVIYHKAIIRQKIEKAMQSMTLKKNADRDANIIKALKKQIDKMKCCANCRHSRTEYEHCRTNKHEKWEIKEND